MLAGRHELKLLNLSVIIYIVFGALIFHSIGEFDDGPRATIRASTNGYHQDKTNASSSSSQAFSTLNGRLERLRSHSVGRMWNITNQLNILYEANWTQLILAELKEFERQFAESLDQESSQGSSELDDPSSADGLELESDSDGDSLEEKNKKKKNSNNDSRDKNTHSASTNPIQGDKIDSSSNKQHQLKAKASKGRRMESIKKSLVHSLATITTMGSPSRKEHSKLGKLLTIIYGTLGIPLLLVTVARTGHSLARSSLNSLLIIRHYCFSLPLHYLCCSCQMFACLKWMLRLCCCCCCCAYLCCCLYDSLRGDQQPRTPKQNKRKRKCCCDVENAPKLNLRPKIGTESEKQRSRNPNDGPSSSTDADRQRRPNNGNINHDNNSAYVIGFSTTSGGLGEQQKFLSEDKQLGGKSVRFATSGGGRISSLVSVEDQESMRDKLNDLLEEQNQRQEDGQYFTPSVFVTSLSFLVVYLACGTYYLSKRHCLGLLESAYTSYSMFSGTKLPDWFYSDSQLQQSTLSALEIYKSISAEQPRINKQFAEATSLHNDFKRRTFESLVLDSVYLLIGLNLISTCANFARLWWSNRNLPSTRLCSSVGGGCDRSDQDQSGPSSAIKANGIQMSASNNILAGGSSSLMGSLQQNGPLSLQAVPYQTVAVSNSPLVVSAATTSQLEHQSLSRKPNKQRDQQQEQINLAELYVIGNGNEQANNGHAHHHSHDVSFASEEAQSSSDHGRRSNSNSLCRHHQQALFGSGSLQRQPEAAGLVSFVAGHQQELDDDDQVQVEQMLRACMQPVGKLPLSTPSSNSTSNLYRTNGSHRGHSSSLASAGNSTSTFSNTLTRRESQNGRNPGNATHSSQNFVQHPLQAVTYTNNNNDSYVCQQYNDAQQPPPLDSSPNTVDTTSQQTISSSTMSNTNNGNRSGAPKPQHPHHHNHRAQVAIQQPASNGMIGWTFETGGSFGSGNGS